MTALKETIEAWNNYCHNELASQWRFLVFDNNEPVGYITDEFAEKVYWDNAYFEKIRDTKTIRLNPNTDNGCEPNIKDCNQALEEFCEQNKEVPGLEEGLKPWVNMKKAYMKLDFHPVLSPRKDLQGLQVPSPVRGIFGIITAGVHMNAYTTIEGKDGNSVVDRIWVAKRSDTTTFPGCFDQIVAGAMDPTDEGSPIKTLKHEAQEEAMWRLEDDGLIFESDLIDIAAQEFVGDVQDSGRIYFCTKKDKSAGEKEVDHIEPGVRFCFDLKVKNGVQPIPNEQNKSIKKFFALEVNEVIKSLEDKKWKPNSGLVMLHFLHRKGLVDEEKCKGIEALGNLPPLPLPDFDHSS